MKQSSLPRTTFLGILFHALIIIFIVLNHPVSSPVASSDLIMKGLLTGKDPYIPSGMPFSEFKPLLPPHEKVSFIMDFPFSPYGRGIEQLYAAQSFLTPTVLTYETTQRAAIVYCSNTAIAERRLEESGYRVLVPLGNGKGIAVKK